MKIINLLITGGLTLIVISLALQLPNIQNATRTSQYHSPSTIPVAFIVSTMTLFVIIFVRDLLRLSPQSTDEALQTPADLSRPGRLIFLVASIGYVLCFEPLGFLVSSLIYLTGTAFLIGSNGRRELVIAFGIAIGTVSFVYMIVTFGLESYLPDFFNTGL